VTGSLDDNACSKLVRRGETTKEIAAGISHCRGIESFTM
jgi:hypothetical protein